MRHGNKINNLKRKKAHRVALLRNMSANLIEHKRIFTTLAKAKALRKHIEPLITKSKNNDTHNRRVCFAYLQNKEAVKELFEVVGPKVADRPGGYTRIIKLQKRYGDAADMAMIELVDFNEEYTGKVEKKTTKKRRTRRSKKAAEENTQASESVATEEVVAEAQPEEPQVEDPKIEESTDDETNTTEEGSQESDEGEEE